ncbi:radical SAM protein [uncultured Empedobacter sp.]|uniref:radical SAM protein n=1 Tax=uncultured Empedobacter sp. TaxID=410844 RepID=UPI0025F7E00C|nr:radical SAM protein [uncultured Empedobacter sp.]
MNRLILTYNQSCNLKCKFCYINFHYKKVNDKTIDIIKIAIENNFKIITFGGGDAFSKKSFRKACILAKENNIITHVDTNAIAIKDSDIDFINKYIDILGISIDAIGKHYNDFRDSKLLFEKVENILNRLEKNGKRNVKINTIISKENKHHIKDIEEYINNFNIIKRWSLYQFFPLSSAKNNESKYIITNEEFDYVTKDLNYKNTNLEIELMKFNSRVNGYIFCDEEGNVYTNTIVGEYLFLFSIFDPEIESKLSNLPELINPKIKDRYQ